MKYNFKEKAKVAGMTVAEISVLTGTIVLTKKFLDFNVLFKNKIAADPTFANKWYIKHQGAIKLVGGALAAAHVDNPWLKLLFIGVAIEGAITELRTVTTDDAGVSFFDKIGRNPANDAANAQADAILIDMARKSDRTAGVPQEYGSTVGYGVTTNADSIYQNVSGVPQEYGSTVGAWNDGALVEWRYAG